MLDLPEGRFEVELLLEAMLAFPDQEALAVEVARVLEPGGRLAFAVEEGRPLTEQERTQMPGADTIWLIELTELTGVPHEAGLWSDWLGSGRVRKFAMVAEKQ